MIKVSSLSKNYGNLEVLNSISLNIAKGEIVGLLGQNGAGKTTLMRIITGYIPPTAGKAYIDGMDISEIPIEAKKIIGYLPENCPLYPEMSVEDFLITMASLHGLKGKALNERLSYVLESVKIKDKRRHIISTLSKGYKQRVGLAQALIHNPKVLILDEPTVGLDPNQIIEIRSLIKDLKGDRTIILSSHILPEVSQTCERIIIISRGNIVAEGSEDDLVSNMSNDSKLYISLADKAQSACKLLASYDGVREVRLCGSNGIEIDMDKDLDIRASIAKLLIDEGFSLLEMRREEMTLEKIFISSTAKQ